MLSELFYWLLNMSVSASIAGLVILLLEKIHKIPRRIMHILFMIPFFRMWVPIGMGSRYSLMSLISRVISKTVVVYEGNQVFSMTNFVMAADTYFPLTYKTDLLKEVFQIAALVWIIVAMILLLATAFVYTASMLELKDARHLQDNIYLSQKITSPAVYGIVREKIILGEGYKEADLKFILMHEKAHIKRKDNVWRLLGIITMCIHWFNPFLWLFLKAFLTNLELACDETVLKDCSEADKKNYAEVLLNCAESKSLYASAFGGTKLRVRIDFIFSYQKLSLLSIAAFFLLVSAVGYVLLTNAM